MSEMRIIEGGSDYACIILCAESFALPSGWARLKLEQQYEFLQQRAESHTDVLYLPEQAEYYEAGVLVNEELNEAIADRYYRLEGHYYLANNGTRLYFGGVECWDDLEEGESSGRGELDLTAGAYQLQVFERDMNEERDQRDLKREIGREQMEYYHAKEAGCGGCFLVTLLGLIPVFMDSSWWLLALPLYWSIWGIIDSKRRSGDEYFQKIAVQVGDWRRRNPEIIFAFYTVDGCGQSDGRIDVGNYRDTEE